MRRRRRRNRPKPTFYRGWGFFRSKSGLLYLYRPVRGGLFEFECLMPGPEHLVRYIDYNVKRSASLRYFAARAQKKASARALRARSRFLTRS